MSVKYGQLQRIGCQQLLGDCEAYKKKKKEKNNNIKKNITLELR